MADSSPISAPAPGRFERFRVVARTRESSAIVSFELVPVDGARSLAFTPGQFVVLRLTLPDGERVLRHYSLSGDPADTSRWRISIKREDGSSEAPPGRGSTYLHASVDVGTELELAGPAGAFVCDESSERPVLLLSGGVGVTPLVSMLHRLSRASHRRVHFIHACENSAVHAFADEIRALAAARDHIDVHVCYRQPLEDDHARDRFDSRGLVTRELLQSLLPLDDYDVYLCGPSGFMQANWRLLRGLGIARERIHYEFFGPATVLDSDSDTATSARDTTAPSGTVVAPGTATPDLDGDVVTVRFRPDCEPIYWLPEHGSLLEMAEQAGYAPTFNCRAGLCNACMTPLLSGSVAYDEAPLSPPPEGSVLLCCARPVGAVTLDLQPAR
ncbi:FAD-binding oxidoreductase [Burkholderia sp. IMCC1007]|uniref:FAD-binding oxidoreductase n=1 Tax=Burkholderia sp. IMCC1007 TaxID=3004104 RepID=UPI0022B2DE9A|nr:FAD-binding oxidoreductase [Burkholderia sp. IMCC1007]